MIIMKIVLLTFMLFLLPGCVGTVEDTAEPLTEIASKAGGSIHFTGIYQAVPISQDKIEIFFYPATGASTKYYYTFYVGDRPIPYTVPSESLKEDYRGLLKFTVTGLEPAKTYIAKGNAVDQVSGEPDNNAVTVSVKTFSNLVADFHGISALYNTAGVEGTDSINVRWTHASIDYGNITGNAPTDPKSYEIVAVDTDRLTPADMDKPQFGPADGRYKKIVDYDPTINEAIIRGLKSNTKYYVRVQAIHNASIESLNDENLKGEKNSNYLSIKTLDSDLANIKFLETLVASKNPGISSSTSLILGWQTITGVYDHLRLIYTVSPNPLTLEQGASCGVKPDNEVSCRKIFGNTLSTIVGNLPSSQTFFFQLVACQDAECNLNRAGPIITANTFPTFAGFSGLQSVDIASGVSEIGKFFLRIPLPDFSVGDFDGYIIGFKSNLGDDFVEISETPHVSMIIEDYNHRTDTTITIRGVDYNAGGFYCFSVYPFVYNPDTSKTTQPNGVWKCATPEIVAPTAAAFPGLTEASAFGNSILTSWSQPSVGIFENFELFLRITPGQFSYSEAKAQVSSGMLVDYVQVVLPWFIETYTFSNLPISSNYKVGIVTRYVSGASATYNSEDNDAIYNCNVDAALDGGGNFIIAPCTGGP